MKRVLIIILLLASFLQGCEKLYIPEGYPTTFVKLSEPDLNQKRTTYRVRNPYLITSLNEFGFSDMDGELLNSANPPFIGEVSESDAINIVKNFVSTNTAETGITDFRSLQFVRKSMDRSYDGAIVWHFKSGNQKVDTIEVLFTQVLFHLENGYVRMCYGNWYPDIFVPERFNFSQNEAKSLLKGRTVYHYTIAGQPMEFTISGESLEKSSFNMKIVPVSYDNRIEARVCWKIHVPSVFFNFYIDVITGDIVKEEPTIIS